MAGAIAGGVGDLGACAGGYHTVAGAGRAVRGRQRDVVLVGLYLAGAGSALIRLEALGAPLWRRLQPLAARLLPADTLPQLFAAARCGAGCHAAWSTARSRRRLSPGVPAAG